ncbi:MAG: rhomboid family intramembrane serine protease [Promethearchaeota archaeon]
MSLFSLEGKERGTTVSLVVVNLACFFAFDVALGSWGLLYLAQVNALVLEGQVWRLFTSMFVHGGLFHVVSNVLALLLFGVQLEDEVGGKKLVVAYLSSGFVANLAGLLVTPAWVYSLGASGCIFGVVGAYFVMLRRLDPAALLVGVAFVALFVVLSVGPGIDAWAHLFGAVVGCMFGLAWSRGRGEFEDVY